SRPSCPADGACGTCGSCFGRRSGSRSRPSAPRIERARPGLLAAVRGRSEQVVELPARIVAGARAARVGLRVLLGDPVLVEASRIGRGDQASPYFGRHVAEVADAAVRELELQQLLAAIVSPGL